VTTKLLRLALAAAAVATMAFASGCAPGNDTAAPMVEIGKTLVVTSDDLSL
jgi:hypothetical protein